MRSAVLGSLILTAIAVSSPLEAQIVPRRVPGETPVVREAPAPSEMTLSRVDDAAPPANLTASPAMNGVSLTWSPAPDASGYTVLRSPAAAGPFDPVSPAGVADTQYTDTGLAAATTYFYIVTAARADGHYGTSQPVAVTTTGRVLTRERPGPVFTPVDTSPMAWGFADLHTHQLADLGFGGLFFWGASFGAPAHALQACDPAHGPGGSRDLIGNVMGERGNHHTGGDPHYDGWPVWHDLNHQQMHVDWLKRAVDGGLRLMVMDAVNNELYCQLTPKAAGINSCNDMDAAKLQIQQARNVETYVDNQNGGPGQGWYRIVTSAKEARETITAGKLAVVLGIEVDRVLDCDNCSPAQVRQRLQEVYDMGVRKIIPVHLANNTFGGAALYNPLFQFNNFFIRKRFIDAFDCSNQGIAYRFDPVSDTRMGIVRAMILNNPIAMQLLGLSPGQTPPSPPGGQCNVQDLTSLGNFLVHEMMSKHMLIDVAHMGMRTLESTLAVTDSSDYPVIASHSGLLDVAAGGTRSERQLTNGQIAMIRKNGGLIGIGIGGGSPQEIATVTRIKHDCSKSAKSFANEYLAAVDRVKGDPVAFGSDLNGLEEMPAPRFGNDGCARDGSPPQPVNTMVSYPFTGYHTTTAFTRMPFGTRTFDFNTDGFAHVGMYPDFIEDMRKVGMTDAELDPLFRSADAFVRLWEKAESKAIPPLATGPATPPSLAVHVVPQAPTETTRRVLVQAKDRQTGAAQAGTVSIFVVRGGSRTTVSGPTGQVLSYTPCQRVVRVSGERDLVETCGGRVSVAGYPDAPFTAP